MFYTILEKYNTYDNNVSKVHITHVEIYLDEFGRDPFTLASVSTSTNIRQAIAGTSCNQLITL